jgi:AdoMet-dependent rRNA methyltransferase SPB1
MLATDAEQRSSLATATISLPIAFPLTPAQTHFRPQLPVSREEILRIKDRFREISARPIAKVAEARARKKRRLVTKLQSAKKKVRAVCDLVMRVDTRVCSCSHPLPTYNTHKNLAPSVSMAAQAESILDQEELGDRGKAKAIAKLYKGAEAKKPGKVYVVSAHGKQKGSTGTKGGRVSVVDPRLKKDKKSARRADKKKKGGGGRRK